MQPTNIIKAEVEKNVTRLFQLRDEAKVRLHLASLEAKTEWDEKLAPRLFELEQNAKSLGESAGLGDLVEKLEAFVGRLQGKDQPPHSTH